MPGNGMVLAGGRCLTTKEFNPSNGNPVVLNECVGDLSQQWLQRQDGRLVNTLSSRCLTPNSGDLAAATHIADCDPARSEQVWRTPNQRGTSGKLFGPAGRCLDVPANNPMTNAVQLWGCNDQIAQSWTAPGDGSLRGDGKCLNVDGAPAEGTGVNLSECSGTQAQQWVAQPDGTLVNPVSGRCLTAASLDDGAKLSITNCAAGDRQIWRMTAETLFRGAVVGVGTKCLDVDQASGKMLLWDCYGATSQAWWSDGNDRIRVFGKCVDISGTAGWSAVILVPCNGGESQQWVARYDGTVVNPLTNTCLDDDAGNTQNGTLMHIVECHRGINQRWSTPVNPS